MSAPMPFATLPTSLIDTFNFKPPLSPLAICSFSFPVLTALGRHVSADAAAQSEVVVVADVNIQTDAGGVFAEAATLRVTASDKLHTIKKIATQPEE